jgi:FkbM family methyltransferase
MLNLKKIARLAINTAVNNTITRRILLLFTRAKLMPDFILNRLFIATQFTVSTPGGKPFQYQTLKEDYLGNTLFWRGEYEPETTIIFQQLAKKARVILDIGANTGFFSMLALAANESARAIAFEPVPANYKLLKAHIKINDWEERISLEPQAVSNFVGTTKFHIPFDEVPLSGSLELTGFRGYEGELIEVRVTSIDAFYNREEAIDLVKIDVEGFEDKVLEGMSGILTRFSPDLIVECNHDGPFLNIEAILQQFGYRFFHLVPQGAIPVEKIRPDSQGHYRNYLCTVKENL